MGRRRMDVHYISPHRPAIFFSKMTRRVSFYTKKRPWRVHPLPLREQAECPNDSRAAVEHARIDTVEAGSISDGINVVVFSYPSRSIASSGPHGSYRPGRQVL